jgi:hypothetical protein
MTTRSTLGLIGQILNRMGKGHSDIGRRSSARQPRFMNEMTMEEIWLRAQPKRPDVDRRI